MKLPFVEYEVRFGFAGPNFDGGKSADIRWKLLYIFSDFSQTQIGPKIF